MGVLVSDHSNVMGIRGIGLLYDLLCLKLPTAVTFVEFQENSVTH